MSRADAFALTAIVVVPAIAVLVYSFFAEPTQNPANETTTATTTTVTVTFTRATSCPPAPSADY